MLTFLLVTGLIIALGLNVATFILIRILLEKIGVYEQWVLELKDDVSKTVDTMRKIDGESTFKSSFEASGKGTFESDDQVGQVFKELVEIVEKLNERIQ
jgi:hypothetical protein